MWECPEEETEGSGLKRRMYVMCRATSHVHDGRVVRLFGLRFLPCLSGALLTGKIWSVTRIGRRSKHRGSICKSKAVNFHAWTLPVS